MKRVLLLLAFAAIFTTACENLDNSSDTIVSELLGQWLCYENNQLKGTATYTVTISVASSDSTLLYISNFYQLTGYTATARIDGHTLTIPSQVVDGNTITGQGTVNDALDKIVWSYQVDDGSGQPDVVTATYTKQ
jgi:hypothetical protein